MAYSSDSDLYAYGQGPTDSYADVQYNRDQTRAIVTDQQWGEQYGNNIMTRNNSNFSNFSEVSLSSSNTYVSIPSPTTPTGNMHFGGYSTVAKTEYGSSSLTPSPWGDSQFTAFDQPESMGWTSGTLDLPDTMRWTPKTLGWTPNSDLLNLYKFVVRNSKEPFFQLMDQWTPTKETPMKVYLDNPKETKKGEFPCLYPWGCKAGKQDIFNRPADLERHYKNVHAPEEEKDQFPCDYTKCERAEKPFSRKDHYRDHLRDFHKEDIGSAKGEKKMDEKKRLAAQKSWRAERRISPRHWRCAKCLVKYYVDYNGWECEPCKTTCEQERREARMKLAPKEEVMEPMEEVTDTHISQYDNTQYSNTDTSSATSYIGCGNCQNGWVVNGSQWVACQCQRWR